VNDVGVVLVNYNSGWLCASAVRSLLAQEFTGRDGGRGTLQLVVVDNASPQDQHAELEPLRDLGVTVIYGRDNIGYGRGMNLGMNAIDAEFVLLANPDILVLPGAFAAMLAVMRGDPRAGVVGPRGYLDAGRFILLPPNDLPSLALHTVESLGRVHQGIARRAAHARSRRYLRAWTATEAFDTPMISGFAMFFRADLARRLGPFDPHFPFYFEDADLCRRVRRAGYRVVLEPRAEMVHFFDQSAKSARAEVMKKYEVSRGYYYSKHWGRCGTWLFDRLNAYASRHAESKQGWRFHECEDLGRIAAPPVLTLEGDRDWVLELATDPAFLFCGGHLGRGGVATIGETGWNMLDATRWYLRVLDPTSLAIVKYVTFEKATHSLGPVPWERCRELLGDAP
jgi:GT2 family glycosyltransferase